MLTVLNPPYLRETRTQTKTSSPLEIFPSWKYWEPNPRSRGDIKGPIPKQMEIKIKYSTIKSDNRFKSPLSQGNKNSNEKSNRKLI